MPEKLGVCQKLCVIGLLVLFLLIAVGVAIDSNSLATQTANQGKSEIDVAIAHIFYGLNFAVAVMGISALGVVVAGFILALVVGTTMLALDRAMKPTKPISTR